MDRLLHAWGSLSEADLAGHAKGPSHAAGGAFLCVRGSGQRAPVSRLASSSWIAVRMFLAVDGDTDP